MDKKTGTFLSQCSWKRIMSFTLALVLLLALFPAGAFTANAAAGDAIFFVPSDDWKSDNARFAAYFFGAGDTWIGLEDTDGDNRYEGTIPEGGYTHVIFCRMSCDSTENNWDNKWNQTGDLALEADKNCFTLDAGWDGNGTWSFIEVTPPETDPPETEAPTRDVTVYFKNTDNWTNIHAYAWEQDGFGELLGTWPGAPVSEAAGNEGWYAVSFEDLQCENIGVIFNNGSGGIGNQTSDILLNAIPADGGEYWYDGTLSDETPEGWVVVPPETEPQETEPVESEPSTGSRDVTVHYRNVGMWETVNAYSWDLTTQQTFLGSWPGSPISTAEGHENWYTATVKNLDTDAIGIIFNNGSAQTSDIKITDIPADGGEYWYDGELLTSAPESWEDGSVELVDYNVKLHFANHKNWGSVYLYTWGTYSTGGWPGVAVSQDADGFYSMELNYQAGPGMGLNFIFSGNGQTVDLALQPGDFVNNKAEKWVVPTDTNSEGKFLADIVDSPDAIAISPVVKDKTVTFMYKGAVSDTVQVFGSWNNWAEGITMTANAHGVFSASVENVSTGLLLYKFVVNGNWILDPLNSWTEYDADGNSSSAFLISDPTLDINKITINVHYDAPTPEWNVCAWGAPDLAKQYDFADGVATITLEGRAAQYIAFKVRKSLKGNDWAEQSGEIRIGLSDIVSGTIDVYVDASLNASTKLNGDVVMANKVSGVELDYDNNTVSVTTLKAVSDPETAFGIYHNGEAVDLIEDVSVNGSTVTFTLNKTLELVNLYQYTVRFFEQVKFTDYDYAININTVYASDKFAEEFTYTGGDLGSKWTPEKTTFKVWAPTAADVSVALYATGSDAEAGAKKLGTYAMTAGNDGEWTVEIQGDIRNTYYTYLVNVNGKVVEACDPYAQTTGVNGKRAMVVDLDSTDPEGWENDKNPNPLTSYTDAVIYELHVRDFSIDDSSGVSEANRGKFMAFTEEGTTVNGEGLVSTGVDYLSELGITHLHLLPIYDYASVDETTCENFNWGYDPQNYNVPEGSYSTNPYDGNVRVNEMKQMVQSLHNNGISVIMDVVYNHVYDAGTFAYNQIVPKYFSRVNADGSYSNGSGCGNDTASEREMVRDYIVASVMYWKEEYHIDGFRFDLVGLLDATTINQIVDTVHEKYPDVIFYGEGWTMGTAVEPGNIMATQVNSAETPEFAYFSDTMRNLIGGSNGSSTGFASGSTGREQEIAENFMARPWWSSNPTQIIQYASCHDNYTLIDKLILSTGKSGIDSEIIKMNNLTASIYMMSQGVPFIHAGEEFLREKLEEDGGRCENSYNAPDSVNHIEWSNLYKDEYIENSAYYKGLIEFRKAHSALHLSTAAEVTANVSYTKVTNNTVMFTINGANGDPSDQIIVIYNANKGAVNVNLPAGNWSVCIDGEHAGADELYKASGNVSVEGISAMVLVKGGAAEHEHDPITYVTPATCTENGQYISICKCGMTSNATDIPALGHSFTNYVSNNDATTEADGTKTAKCDRCDATDTITDEGSRLLTDVKMIGTNPHITGNIVSWEAVPNAKLYQVYRLKAGESTWVLLKNTGSLAYKDTEAEVGTKYYYKVRARNDKQITSMNIESVAAIRPIANVVMAGATAHKTGNIIRWNAVEGAKLYQVYRLRGGETTWTLLKNTGSLAYKDETAEVGVKYYYKVRARAGSAISSMNIASVSAVRPADITKLDDVKMDKAIGHSTGNIVYWNAVANAKFYQVYRLRSGETSWTLLTNTGSLGYKDTTAEVGVKYYYKVVARNGDLKSSMSIASVSAVRPK